MFKSEEALTVYKVSVKTECTFLFNTFYSIDIEQEMISIYIEYTYYF